MRSYPNHLYIGLATFLISTPSHAQISPQRTCSKVAQAITGERIDGFYIDAFAAGGIIDGYLKSGVDWATINQLSNKQSGTINTPSPVIPRYSVTIAAIESFIPIQQQGLQTICKISAILSGEIELRI